MFKAKMLGRDAVMRRLRDLVPNIDDEVAIEQLEVAKELAKFRA